MNDDDYWMHLYVMLSRVRTLEQALLFYLPDKTIFEKGPPTWLTSALKPITERANADLDSSIHAARHLNFITDEEIQAMEKEKLSRQKDELDEHATASSSSSVSSRPATQKKEKKQNQPKSKSNTENKKGTRRNKATENDAKRAKESATAPHEPGAKKIKITTESVKRKANIHNHAEESRSSDTSRPATSTKRKRGCVKNIPEHTHSTAKGPRRLFDSAEGDDQHFGEQDAWVSELHDSRNTSASIEEKHEEETVAIANSMKSTKRRKATATKTSASNAEAQQALRRNPTTGTTHTKMSRSASDNLNSENKKKLRSDTAPCCSRNIVVTRSNASAETPPTSSSSSSSSAVVSARSPPPAHRTWNSLMLTTSQLQISVMPENSRSRCKQANPIERFYTERLYPKKLYPSENLNDPRTLTGESLFTLTPTPLRGLKNPRHLCFANAALQILLRVKPLRDALLFLQGQCQANCRCHFCLALQLANDLQCFSGAAAARPSEVTAIDNTLQRAIRNGTFGEEFANDSSQWTPAQDGPQCDIFDFIEKVLSRIDERLATHAPGFQGNETCSERFLQGAALGSVTRERKLCTRCGTAKDHIDYETFLKFPLEKPQSHEQHPVKLEELWRRNYDERQEMKSERECIYRMDGCASSGSHRTQTFFEREPPLAFMQIKRTVWHNNNQKKIKTRIEVPLRLQMPRGGEYELCAAILHMGDAATEGHYTCICKANAPASSDGSPFFELDDGNEAIPFSFDEFTRERFQRSVYGLLYTRTQPAVHRASTVASS